MPLFDYACANCGHHFEALLRCGSAAPEGGCPRCQSHHLEKQLSVFATKSSSSSGPADMPMGACGSCGHPGGPGACGMPGLHWPSCEHHSRLGKTAHASGV